MSPTLYIVLTLACAGINLAALFCIAREHKITAFLMLFFPPVFLYGLIVHRDDVGGLYIPWIFAIITSIYLVFIEDDVRNQAQVEHDIRAEAQANAVAEGEQAAAVPEEREKPTFNYKADKKGYEKHCATCHDSGLVGAPKIDDTARWNELLSNDPITGLIGNAVKGKGGHPKKGGCDTCSVTGVENMSYYLIVTSGATIE